MEPPAKRRRLSVSDQSPKQDVVIPKAVPAQPSRTENVPMTVTMPPSKTWNAIQASRTHAQGEHDLNQKIPHTKRGMYLFPRQVTTLTAGVLEIHVDDGNGTTRTTEIAPPVTGTILSLDIGTVTVPPITFAGTNSTNSTTSTSAASSISSGFSLPANLTNATSISNQTVTVTATSTLNLTVANGTTSTQASNSTYTTTMLVTSTIPAIVVTTESANQLVTITEVAETVWTGIITTVTEGHYPNYAVPTVASSNHGVLTSGSTSTTGPIPSTSSIITGTNGSNGPPALTPQQQQVVGGVVGGVAGVAVILLIFFAFMRFFRPQTRHYGMVSDGMQRSLQGGSGAGLSSMSQSFSHIPIVGAIADSLQRFRAHNSHSISAPDAEPESSVIGSEKGFQRIAGRKLPPVISTGGDGYGGTYGVFEDKTQYQDEAASNSRDERRLAGSSFYGGRGGFYSNMNDQSAPSTPTLPPSNPFPGDHNDSPDRHNMTPVSTRDFASHSYHHNPSLMSVGQSHRSEQTNPVMVIRPSPARTPITQSPAASSVRLSAHRHSVNLTLEDDGAPPLPALHHARGPSGGQSRHEGLGLSVPMPHPRERDSVGRSLASQDGSRYSTISRTSIRSTPRFTENL